MDTLKDSVTLSREHYNVTYPNTKENEKAMRGLNGQIASMFAVAGETPETTRGKTCLELGCGTGEETYILVTKYGLTVTAVELNESSLQQARKIMIDNGISDKVQFLNQDLHSLDAGNQQFDFVFSKGVIHHLHTPSRVVPKALSHLKSGGKCIFRINWLYGWMFKKGGIISFWKLKLLWILYPDREKRMVMGEKWFYRPEKITSGMEKRLIIEDIFGSIYKPMRLASFLRWFRQSNVVYENSWPNHALTLLFEKDFKLFQNKERQKRKKKIARIFVSSMPFLRLNMFKKLTFISRSIVQFLYMCILRSQLTMTVVGRKK